MTYKNKHFYIENISVEKLSKRFGTPAYIYSYSNLKNNIENFKRYFKTFEPIICFSVKSNSNLKLLSIIGRFGLGADVVSKGELLKALKANIKPENVLITPGGKPVIFISALLLGSEDREIIFPDPGFPIYRSMIKYSGAKAVPLKLSEKDNFEINTEQLKELISDKTSLIIINNPNNPTGSYMNKKKITDLVNLLEQYPNVSILSDEIYSNIIFNNEQMPSLLEYESIKDRLIVLEGWSKTYCMTGWRLGWSIWPENLIEHANKICVNYNSCATSISQYAGLEAIKGSQKEIIKIVSEFQKRKEYVFNELNKLEKISCFEPGGAFYAFPNISKTEFSGNRFSEIALEEKGVALVPGSSFGDNAGEFVRISFANSLENIKEAINRLSTI